MDPPIAAQRHQCRAGMLNRPSESELEGLGDVSHVCVRQSLMTYPSAVCSRGEGYDDVTDSKLTRCGGGIGAGW